MLRADFLHHLAQRRLAILRNGSGGRQDPGRSVVAVVSAKIGILQPPPATGRRSAAHLIEALAVAGARTHGIPHHVAYGDVCLGLLAAIIACLRQSSALLVP